MRIAALLLGLAGAAAALPAPAQTDCPWAGAVRKLKDGNIEVWVDHVPAFEDEEIFGLVRDMPACDITIGAVRRAAARPDCSLYADRPDALGIEMVLSCMLEETGGAPEPGTTVVFSSTAAQRLLTGE